MERLPTYYKLPGNHPQQHLSKQCYEDKTFGHIVPAQLPKFPGITFQRTNLAEQILRHTGGGLTTVPWRVSKYACEEDEGTGRGI